MWCCDVKDRRRCSVAEAVVFHQWQLVLQIHGVKLKIVLSWSSSSCIGLMYIISRFSDDVANSVPQLIIKKTLERYRFHINSVVGFGKKSTYYFLVML